MDKLLNVSTAPHVRHKDSTATIMRDVCIAMAFPCLFGIYNSYRYGELVNSIVLLIICVGVCVLSEYCWQKAMKKKVTVGDYSAVVTGMILYANLPASFPWWMAVLGSVFAIIVVKQMYGGLGQNFMNPALGARCFLMISFTSAMTSFPLKASGVDTVASATPLGVMRNGGFGADGVAALKEGGYSIMDMFVGTIPGTIGETSVIAVLIGAAYLLARKVIKLWIPCSYLITFAVVIFLFGGFNAEYVLAMLMGGGIMLGAFFMATDYVTSPITRNGQIVFGIVLGVLTGIFRLIGGSAEGVSYAIIITNLFVPFIEKFTLPKAFGKESVKNGK